MRRLADPLLLALLALSLSVNVYLYRGLRDPVRPVGSVKPGDHVPEFSAPSSRGGVVDVRFGSRSTILYVFSPKCSWCARNLANARALERQTAGRYQFFAIALDDSDLEGYLAHNALDWPVLTRLPDQVQKAYHFGITPETVVVDTGGAVVHVWAGAYEPHVARDIDLKLGVRLPGLIDLNTSDGALGGG